MKLDGILPHPTPGYNHRYPTFFHFFQARHSSYSWACDLLPHRKPCKLSLTRGTTRDQGLNKDSCARSPGHRLLSPCDGSVALPLLCTHFVALPACCGPPPGTGLLSSAYHIPTTLCSHCSAPPQEHVIHISPS